MLSSSKTLYTKLVRFLIKNGNKKKAKQIIDTAFLRVSYKTNQSLVYILLKVFSTLNSFVEARTFKMKKRSFVVPFSLTFGRRIYLIAKWLVTAAILTKKRTSLSSRLTSEILLILKKHPSSKALQLKSLNTKKANANRSNLHFRW